VQMNTCLLMYRYPVRTCLGKRRNEQVGIFNHQVAIDRNIDSLAESPQHRRSDRDIRNEMPVHHVEMENRAAAFYCGSHLLSKPRKISGKYRRRKLDQSVLSRRVSVEILARQQLATAAELIGRYHVRPSTNHLIREGSGPLDGRRPQSYSDSGGLSPFSTSSLSNCRIFSRSGPWSLSSSRSRAIATMW
jgi:hypothetical protein